MKNLIVATLCLVTSINIFGQKILTQVFETWTNNNWQNSSKFTYGYDGSGYAISYFGQGWNTGSNSWTNASQTTLTNNGDGTVNATDANAIFANWGSTHTFKLNEETVVNPDLTIVPDQPLVQIGTWGTASIYLGGATNNINLYGLAFDANHNNALVATDSIYVKYINAFLNTGGTNI